MYTHWITWPQQKVWDKEYPEEMKFLYSQVLPHRENIGTKTYWNWFATPSRIQINILDDELIVLFKLKYSK